MDGVGLGGGRQGGGAGEGWGGGQESPASPPTCPGPTSPPWLTAGPGSPPPPANCCRKPGTFRIARYVHFAKNKELPENHLLSPGAAGVAGGCVGSPLKPAIDPLPPQFLLLLLLLLLLQQGKPTSSPVLPDHDLLLLTADNHPAAGVGHLHHPLQTR